MPSLKPTPTLHDTAEELNLPHNLSSNTLPAKSRKHVSGKQRALQAGAVREKTCSCSNSCATTGEARRTPVPDSTTAAALPATRTGETDLFGCISNSCVRHPAATVASCILKQHSVHRSTRCKCPTHPPVYPHVAYRPSQSCGGLVSYMARSSRDRSRHHTGF